MEKNKDLLETNVVPESKPPITPDNNENRYTEEHLVNMGYDKRGEHIDCELWGKENYRYLVKSGTHELVAYFSVSEKE